MQRALILNAEMIYSKNGRELYIVLVILFGGRDSFLCACKLLDSPQNYQIKMVTYDNGCSYLSGNAGVVADRIIKQYGVERAEYLGVKKISGLIREFFPIF